MSGLNIPLSGFIDGAQQAGYRLHPLCWCSAEPSSYVARDAFERVVEVFINGLRDMQSVDAI
ncbi:MAG: M81 family metallopeptidase [Gammaproteobacteria bacterium]|nr:M81 family metallopeptidase [Gammaproteobacteria bacterium]